MGVCVIRGHTSARGPVDKTAFHQIRFIDIFDRSRVFSNRGSKCVKTHRTAIEFGNHGQKNVSISEIQSFLIDIQKSKRLIDDVFCYIPVRLHLGIISDTPQDPVCDTWCSSGTIAYFNSAGWIDFINAKLTGGIDYDLC